jgi:catechol 2,3-dioxygenase-like lactoylglutathione lyase family enzyme
MLLPSRTQRGGETMEIRQLRLVVRAANFERTCRFYGETLALPRLRSWENEEGRGALFQVGPGSIEVRGRPRGAGGRDETFDYQGPQQKLTVKLEVPSAEKVYQELLFREPNIPGGLRRAPGGAASFETRDPDGVKILFLEPG